VPRKPPEAAGDGGHHTVDPNAVVDLAAALGHHGMVKSTIAALSAGGYNPRSKSS